MRNTIRIFPRQMRKLAISLAAVVLLAQTIITIHGVIHYSLGDQDHCVVAQISPSMSGQLPAAVVVLPALLHLKPLLNLGSLPAFHSVEVRRSLPIRGPPSYA